MHTEPAHAAGTPSTPITLPDLPGDLHAALREDIRRRGILVPVIVDSRSGEVLDGRIRSEIANELGIRDIPTIFMSKLSAKDKLDIRNGLNVYRRHLSRAQIQAAVEWAVRSTPHDSDRKIAGRVGCSPTSVGAARRRAGVQDGHLDAKRIGKDGKSYPSAKPSVYTATRGQTEVIRRNLEALGSDAPDGAMSTRKLRKLVGRKVRAELSAREVTLPSTFSVKCADFRDHGMKPGSIDLVYVDPPWGADWKEHRSDFARENFSILRSGGLAVCYFGQQKMLDWVDVFRSAGFSYRWLMAFVNDDDAGSSSIFGSLLTRWRPVVIFQKGAQRLRTDSMISDVFYTADRDKTLHTWQQSSSEAVHLLRGLSSNGSSIADLTCCTGTSGVACARIGSRKYHGVEIDAGLCRLARSRIANELRK